MRYPGSASRLASRMSWSLSSGRARWLMRATCLLHRNHQAVEVSADDGADRTAGQCQDRAFRVGQYDCLRATPDGRTDVSGGIDAGDIGRAVDVARRAAEARFGSAEGEPVAQAADPDRVLPAME